MQLTQKIQIYPSLEQEKVLWCLSWKCRLIYNFALGERRESYLIGKKVTYQTQQNSLGLTKKSYPEYNIVYSKVLQMALNQLDSDYRSFFALRRNGDISAKPPHFKKKDFFTTMIYNQSGFKVERGCIKLSHKHPSSVPLCFAIPESFSFGRVFQVMVFQDEKQRFFVSVVYEAKPLSFVDNGLYQAFDLGITKHTAVNSCGKFLEFHNVRHDHYWNSTVDYLQSRRDHCKRSSHRWHHWNNAFKKSKRKCARQTRDFQHKLSRKIVSNTRAKTIIVGALNVKGMAQSSRATSGMNLSPRTTGI